MSDRTDPAWDEYLSTGEDPTGGVLTTTPAIEGHTIKEYKGNELIESRQKAMDEMAQPALRDRIISCKEITAFQKKVYLELCKR